MANFDQICRFLLFHTYPVLNCSLTNSHIQKEAREKPKILLHEIVAMTLFIFDEPCGLKWVIELTFHMELSIFQVANRKEKMLFSEKHNWYSNVFWCNLVCNSSGYFCCYKSPQKILDEYHVIFSWIIVRYVLQIFQLLTEKIVYSYCNSSI